MQVQVVPHDPDWQHAFNIEACRIAQALGEPAVTTHHIGSTAIPGIVAKPVIDILLEVERIERLDQQVAAMQCLGYEALGTEFRVVGTSERTTTTEHGPTTFTDSSRAAMGPCATWPFGRTWSLTRQKRRRTVC